MKRALIAMSGGVDSSVAAASISGVNTSQQVITPGSNIRTAGII